MIRINGFSHRDELQALIGRWMLDRPAPADQTRLLRLVHFNSVLVARALSALAVSLMRALHGATPQGRIVLTKGELKDALIAHLPQPSARARDLIARYHAEPGRYYRETPFRGILYFSADADRLVYVGSSRVKRIRRLAEKSTRKVIDWLQEEILPQDAPTRRARDAQHAGAGQARAAAMPAWDRRLLARLEQPGAIDPERGVPGLEINDVAGIKLVLEPAREADLMGILGDLDCVLIEREQHGGDYKAVNLLVDHRPDLTRIQARPLPDEVIRAFQAHGIGPAETSREFTRFLCEDETRLRVEIICATAAETLEGEIGRCMHEDRIIRQRRQPRCQGQLAQNLEFLCELLFTLPAAPPLRLERLPVRLHDRYLPDYFDEVKRGLFGIPSVELDLE
ncbi:MAG: hypothetical protein EOM91_02515 [Sphingobacteriia bacterium]|nr:hypothetical protein [Sphingobacteriia bacterium]NCC39843.1 hypothetical protein [Gammaproteobacteria bacterium]